MSLFAFFSLVFCQQAQSLENNWVKHDISKDGEAVFYHVVQSKKRLLWIVNCIQPGVQCVARTEGAVLRLDEDTRPWLFAMAEPGARVSIQEKNLVLDTPKLFKQPLTNEAVRRLSKKDSFVVIEEIGQPTRRISTGGLDRVISYLEWVTENSKQATHDARLWPHSKEPSVLGTQNEVLGPNLFPRPTQMIAPRQLVPSNKPQSEFAIQSQGGRSFFSEKGRAGY